jgi:hypothetical protein
MKALFGIGLTVLTLGCLSLVVPVPSRERTGVKVGDLSVGVTTRTDEKVAPIVSAGLILGGVGILIASRKAGAP